MLFLVSGFILQQSLSLRVPSWDDPSEWGHLHPRTKFLFRVPGRQHAGPGYHHQFPWIPPPRVTLHIHNGSTKKEEAILVPRRVFDLARITSVPPRCLCWLAGLGYLAYLLQVQPFSSHQITTKTENIREMANITTKKANTTVICLYYRARVGKCVRVTQYCHRLASKRRY